MKKYDVLCPHCCGTFLETNSHFREDGPANGSMFEPKEHIKDAGWSVLPLYDSTEYADITCPSCGGVLVDSLGKLLRAVEIGSFDPVLPPDELEEYLRGRISPLGADPIVGADAKIKLSVSSEAPVKKPRKPRTTKPRGKK